SAQSQPNCLLSLPQLPTISLRNSSPHGPYLTLGPDAKAPSNPPPSVPVIEQFPLSGKGSSCPSPTPAFIAGASASPVTARSCLPSRAEAVSSLTGHAPFSPGDEGCASVCPGRGRWSGKIRAGVVQC